MDVAPARPLLNVSSRRANDASACFHRRDQRFRPTSRAPAPGIVPTKVVRIALENAVSVASVLLLTEATLTELPEPKQPPAAPAGMD